MFEARNAAAETRQEFWIRSSGSGVLDQEFWIDARRLPEGTASTFYR